MKKRKIDLQMFADEPETKEPEKTSDEKKPEKTGRTYTDKEVDEIINKKFAEWAAKRDKAIQDAKAEGEKLAKMSADQKKEYELKQAVKKAEDLEAKVAELTAKQTHAELAKSASKIMADEYNIVATEDHLEFVVGKDAEETKANIEKLAKLLQAERKAGETALARGITPKNTGGSHVEQSEIDKRIAKWEAMK